MSASAAAATSFEPVELSPAERDLQRRVRSFLRSALPEGSYEPGLGLGGAYSPEFSRALAAQGWVGMSIPVEYGGRGSTAVERFIVAEELLSVGAPIGAHWMADRQTGPTILAFGTEEQKHFFLPRIARGECYFSLGMSEPDSGSDLASVSTRAEEVDGGWVVSGTKVWTTYAHLNHYFVVLCRTSPMAGSKHAGLSQLIVDLSSDGVTVSPIIMLDGSHHLNEVSLDRVFVPHDRVLGCLGDGWRQITSELALERAGPDRYMSTYLLVRGALDRIAVDHGSGHDSIASMVARLWVIRNMSLSIARALDEGRSPVVGAAIVKDLGTTFEQASIELVSRIVDSELRLGATDVFDRLLADAVLTGPTFTLRGGTTEVLRSMAAKALLRGVRP